MLMSLEGKKLTIGYLTKTALKERGWTDGSIRTLLGEPDKTSPNPYSRKKAPVQLFETERVLETESTEEFLRIKNKVLKLRHTASANSEKRKQILVQQKAEFSAAVDRLQPLAAHCISKPKVLEWNHLGMTETDLAVSERQTAVSTVNLMLRKSYWIPVDLFFAAFHQWGLSAANTDSHAEKIANSLSSVGWQGIPLVSFFLKDKMGRIQLDSGHHRWIALQRLRISGAIDANFRVPVFDLNLMPSCLERKKDIGDALNALDFAESGHYILALKVFGRENWMLSLCSGIDF